MSTKKTILVCLFFFAFACMTLSQTVKKSSFTLTRSPARTVSSDSCQVIIKFIGPTNDPVKSNVKMKLNNDSILPAIDGLGVYTTTLPKSKYIFQFFVPFWHELCTDTIALKGNETVHITVYFQAKDMRMPEVRYNLGKPAIYFYPEKITKTSVTLGLRANMTFSYPEYKNGWEFIANPDGTLNYNHKTYNYLFWEGSQNLNNITTNFTNGFVVQSDTLVDFLEHSLANCGLNQKESQDFITFWAPKMLNNKLNYVHFVFNKEYDYFATINIQPPPKNLIRVFMLWTGIETSNLKNIKPQLFPEFSRSGYTVMEWGGTELDRGFLISKLNTN